MKRRRQETGDRRQETGDRRQEAGDRRQETGDRRQETGDRKQEEWEISRRQEEELSLDLTFLAGSPALSRRGASG